MPILSPSFLFSLESNLRVAQVGAYDSLLNTKNRWVDKVARFLPTGAGKEIVSWLIESAGLDQSLDPSVEFKGLSIQEMAFVPEFIKGAIEIQRSQLEDLDGRGVQVLQSWVKQIAAQAFWWPQKQTAKILAAGETGLAFDNVSFFNVAHPVTQLAGQAAFGTYANLFTGAPYSVAATDANQSLYPGALNITSATAAQVFTGLQGIFGYIASIKQADGITPRFLTPKYTLLPPNLYPIMSTTLNARFIAMSNGSQDITGNLNDLGFGQPLLANELTDGYSFYIVAEEAGADELGAIAYVEREPIAVRYFTGEGGGNMTDSFLSENDTVKYISRGRAVAGYGLPYKIFKVKAT